MNEKNNENRNGRKILPFSWEYGQEEITLKVSSYAYGNGLAILMYRQEEGELELFDDLTVNLPGGYGLKPQEAFISGDFTKDKLAFIEKNRLGNILPGQARSGFATYTPVDSPGMTGKGWKNFADNGDWMCQKSRKKSKGNLQATRKEKEGDKNIWK